MYLSNLKQTQDNKKRKSNQMFMKRKTSKAKKLQQLMVISKNSKAQLEKEEAAKIFQENDELGKEYCLLNQFVNKEEDSEALVMKKVTNLG